ncbi:MAG: restriction endonuclease subunit S [Desulfuromonadales bacterium]|nr:restriction endonuclease subunit S [Desulfuromonadales bacterium]
MKPDYRIFWESAGGCVPAHWNFVPIADLLENPKSISVGVMYPGADTLGGVPLVRVSDVKDGAVAQCPEFCVSHEVDEEYKRSRFNGTELLITLVGNPGDCAIVSKEMAGWNAARALAVVRLKDPGLRPWLRYVLLSKPAKHLIDARLNTTVQKTLNLKDIKELAVPIPPHDERDRIADIVGGLEKKIVFNRQINQTLEQIAQTLFKSWFVDFEPVKAKIEAKSKWFDGSSPSGRGGGEGLREAQLRAAMCAISGKLEPELDQLSPEQYQQLAATAALFPDGLVESELGLIPVGWEVSEIGQEVTVVGGSTPSTANPDFWDGKFAWVTPKDLSRISEKVLTGSERTISAAGVSKISSGQLPVGTVLLSSRAPIGYLALSMIPVSINQGFIAMICNKRLPNTYVLQWATTSLDSIKQRGSGTTFAEISKSNFRPMGVLVPGTEVLDSFQQLVLPLYEQITASVSEVDSLATLRDTLLPKLLSGELAVESPRLEATA